MTRKNASLIAAPLALAIGIFVTTMMIAPPITEAAMDHGLDIDQISLASAKNLLSFDDTYQRHMGVLDTLR